MKNFFITVFHFSEKNAQSYSDMLLCMFKGTGVTLSIFFLTLLFAIPLALFIAFGKMSKNKIVSSFSNILLSVIRGTPLMLQLLIVYFLPMQVAKFVFHSQIIWDSYTASIVAFSINYACYFAEIYRGGIQSIAKGQYEACKVLGYSQNKAFFRIILPQVVKRIIPAMGNEVITLVKDTSLVTILSVPALMFYAKSNSNRLVSFMPLLIAGVFYFFMNWLVSVLFTKIEKKLLYYS